jgi:hypothetical protein
MVASFKLEIFLVGDLLHLFNKTTPLHLPCNQALGCLFGKPRCTKTSGWPPLSICTLGIAPII